MVLGLKWLAREYFSGQHLFVLWVPKGNQMVFLLYLLQLFSAHPLGNLMAEITALGRTGPTRCVQSSIL